MPDLVSVVVEPLPEHTDDEVVAMLEAQGADEISVLSEGYISARIPRDAIEKVEAVASVQLKTRKTPKR